jgi:hypothetical protein
MSDDISQLQQEWRAIVLKKLDALEAGQEKITNELTEHRLVSPSKIEIEKLIERVGILEESKTKFTGIMIGVNAIILVVAWLIKNAFIK